MRKTMLLCSALLLALAVPASAQEVRLRGANFLPSNQSFGIPFKRWADETNRRGKGVLQIDVVGPEAIPTPEQPNAVKTGVVDLHSGLALNHFELAFEAFEVGGLGGGGHGPDEDDGRNS